MLSKCGSKVLWHWSHASRRHCDPWWENETEWHRAWKSRYPEPWREAIHFDQKTGEKHVADVKTESGQVVEFQNSPMSPEELRSRESFYGNVVWVVNAKAFARRFHFLHKVPAPSSKILEDKVVFPAFRGVVQNGSGGRDQLWASYWKPSENVGRRDGDLVRSRQFDALEAEVEYQGHHLFEWIRPKTVWYEAVAPVMMDFGDDLLWRILRYDSRGLLCVQATTKHAFVETTTQQGLA